MTIDQVVKLLNDHSRDFDRQRTRALARQQWDKVIACDAVLKEIERVRRAVLNELERQSNPSAREAEQLTKLSEVKSI